MKKQGILNARLAGNIAVLGHKDLFMIGDAGMPTPTLVDLALCGGVPTFRQTMDAVPGETEVEFYTLAQEITAKTPELLEYIRAKLPGIECEMIPHAELKKRSADVKFAVRTGKFTPFPNIILRAGAAFSA